MTTPPPPDPPPPPQPSEPFNWDLFAPTADVNWPNFVSEVVREWATDDAGQELFETDPQGGWANVMAFAAEANEKAQPPPPPPPPIKVSFNASSKDIPPDATQTILEGEDLLPKGSPPFSSDPAMQAAPPMPTAPGSPGGGGNLGANGETKPSAGGPPHHKPARGKLIRSAGQPPTDGSAPPNPMGQAPPGEGSIASAPPGQPTGPRPLGNLLPPPPGQ